MDALDSPARLHDAETSARLERSNQNQPAPGAAFHEHIEHPVHAVVHVNVNCSGRASVDERAGARTGKGVASFVVQSEICLCLDYEARAFPPNQLDAHELACANERIALEKGRRQDRPFCFCHNRLQRNAKRTPSIGWRFVVDGQCDAALDGFPITEGRNEFRHPEIFHRGAPEPDQRWLL